MKPTSLVGDSVSGVVQSIELRINKGVPTSVYHVHDEKRNEAWEAWPALEHERINVGDTITAIGFVKNRIVWTFAFKIIKRKQEVQ